MKWPLQVDPLHRLLHDVGLAGPTVAVAILGGDALLTSILHRDLKRSLRLSVALAWLYLVISGARCFVPGDNELEVAFKVIAAVALAMSLAQTLFVLVVDFVLGRNGKKPLRPLMRYGLLGVVFLVAALTGLRAGGVTTIGVLASGAVVVGGLGAAVAEVLRQVGAGILVQYARPFEEGDVVKLGNQPDRGTVVSTNWRATIIRLANDLELLVPNSDFVTQAVINYGHGDRAFRREIYFDAMYDAPPESVKQAVLAAMRDVPEVEADPSPRVLVHLFGDSGIKYQLRYWTKNAPGYEAVDAEVRSRIWYAFARAGLEFPFPTRTMHLAPTPDKESRHRKLASRLQKTALFATLTEDAVLDIAIHGREEPYGSDEVIVKAGEQGRSMHVILDGEVSVQAEDDRRELFRLNAGEFFGEMSLITGAPRTATVVTAVATRTFVLDEPSFRAMITRHPEIADALSEILAQRQTELASKLEKRTVDEAQRRATKNVMLARLKGLFGLA
ncbi:MAG: cyclic nucleotide-binding domain-containing protein [Polyangiales bacterium]